MSLLCPAWEGGWACDREHCRKIHRSGADVLNWCHQWQSNNPCKKHPCHRLHVRPPPVPEPFPGYAKPPGPSHMPSDSSGYPKPPGPPPPRQPPADGNGQPSASTNRATSAPTGPPPPSYPQFKPPPSSGAAVPPVKKAPPPHPPTTSDVCSFVLLSQFHAIMGAVPPDLRRETASALHNNFSRIDEPTLLNFFKPSLRFLSSI